MAYLTLDTANSEAVGTALGSSGRGRALLIVNAGGGTALAAESTARNGIEGSTDGPGYIGVAGSSRAPAAGPGVLGEGNPGVYGAGGITLSNPTLGIGVYGTRVGRGGGPGTYLIGVSGQSDAYGGPWGLIPGTQLFGVSGESDIGIGVGGGTDSGVGVVGDGGRGGVGIVAVGNDSNYAFVTQGGFVGHGPGPATGDVLIQGALIVTGPKSAAVKLRDGSHRALYCVESPECRFEDFGRARLVRGKARVRLDRTFAAVVRTGDYHVFLSPEGLSHGLYVSRRTREGFEVREQHRGTSTVRFSYRIVARRKDVDAPRFKRVKLPVLPKLPFLREIPRPPKPAQMPKPDRAPEMRRLLHLLRTKKRSDRKMGRRSSRAR